MAATVYEFLGNFCHQMPSRSLFLLGSNLGLCVRTFSIYATLAVAGTALVASGRISRWFLGWRPAWGGMLIAPLAIDGGAQLGGVWTSTNPLRAVTGILAGLGLLRLGVLAAEGRRPRRCRRPVPDWISQRVLSCAIALALVFPPSAIAEAPANARTVVLKSGTPVFLVLQDGLTGKDVIVGQRISLRVLRDVKMEDATMIAAGASASGVVAEATRRRSFGGQGTLGIRVDQVEAVDGQLVPLNAVQRAEGTSRGRGAAVTAIVTGVLCLPLALTGFLFRGEDATIPPGAEIKAYTDADVTIKVVRD